MRDEIGIGIVDNGAASGRSRIVRQARALFLAEGYASVSMQQIADAAGVNKATLYHHFRDKEDLFVAVLKEQFEQSQRGIAAALGAGDPLRERLRRVARHLFAAEPSDFGRLAADLRQHVSAERLVEVLGPGTHPSDVLRPAFAEAAAAGELRAVNTELAGQVFFAMVHSRIWWSHLAGSGAAVEPGVADEIVEILFEGIGRGSGEVRDGGLGGRRSVGAGEPATAARPLARPDAR